MPSFVTRDRKAVFIHVPKTGGKSVTDSLATVLDISRFDAGARASMIAAAPDYELAQRVIPYGHARALDVHDFLGPKVFYAAYRFAFLRDPVAHTISGWRAFAGRSGPLARLSFDAWLDKLEADRVERLAYSQWPFVLDDDEKLLVEVRPYTLLDVEFDELCVTRLRITPPALIHSNEAPRRAPELTNEQRERIRALFARDYKLLAGVF